MKKIPSQPISYVNRKGSDIYKVTKLNWWAPQMRPLSNSD